MKPYPAHYVSFTFDCYSWLQLCSAWQGDYGNVTFAGDQKPSMDRGANTTRLSHAVQKRLVFHRRRDGCASRLTASKSAARSGTQLPFATCVRLLISSRFALLARQSLVRRCRQAAPSTSSNSEVGSCCGQGEGCREEVHYSIAVLWTPPGLSLATLISGPRLREGSSAHTEQRCSSQGITVSMIR